MKILALDLGDRWTGSAISDALRMLARPLKTIETNQLNSFLTHIFQEENITTIVVGHPQTLKGTKSAQTQKIEDQFAQLKNHFHTLEWVLWDERLTSDQAAELMRGKKHTKENKLHQHSVAAALILGSYLDHLRINTDHFDDQDHID